jgi:exodeoxyribonuclease VII large subunit
MFSRMTLPLPFETEPERSIYTVSRLNREVRVLLERGMAAFWVEGEISNFSQPPSGHWYFTLKDRTAQVRCVMWKTNQRALSFTPREGLAVVARARITLYEARGEFQISIERIEEAGLGALRRQFDQLKERLAAEGLFALERKRKLPAVPACIGIVTSPTGAAVRDILHVLARRFPPAAVLIYPTPVQGASAVPGIVDALRIASSRRDCDVLILTRGGGSLEDLWAFNDERVARAIVACHVPVVSGVGHEIDFTIADFAADVRAPTPSAAAELVVPDRVACLQAVARTSSRLAVAMTRELRTLESRCASSAKRLRLADPGARLAQQRQRLDDVGLRLSRALATRLAAAGHRVELATRGLNTVSPLATLARGFAIVTRADDGALVTSAGQVAPGDDVEARLANGSIRARVIE